MNTGESNPASRAFVGIPPSVMYGVRHHTRASVAIQLTRLSETTVHTAIQHCATVSPPLGQRPIVGQPAHAQLHDGLAQVSTTPVPLLCSIGVCLCFVFGY